MPARPQRILTADVGGTNCRFGLFVPEGTGWRLAAVASQSSGVLCCEQDFLAALAAGLGVHPQCGDALAVALAGPVEGGMRARLTNGPLRLSAPELGRLWGTRHCLLLNDFTAQAHACHSPAGERASHVAGPQGGSVEAVRAVLGAGTGLGAAQLLHTAGRWQALASEFGHTAFAFSGQEEQALADYLCARRGTTFASCEDVLSGQGLAYLHEFLSGERLSPPEVGAAALSQDSPTLRLYARFYGRVCRHWILSTLCHGGLWLTGGIAQANPACLHSPSFREALLAAGPMQALVGNVPIRLLTDPCSGLWGAAWALLAAA